ncbi:cell division protein ZapA [Alphaproteobacteria bacterium]|nr:cell division protein ZapA [Alphaproteobacteria bacterium]
MTDQIIVKIEINGKTYPISCKIGEEERLISSGKLLSEIISTLDDQNNKISDSKILLMAALILADKNLRHTTNDNETLTQENLDLNEIVSWLEKLNLKFKNIERLINNS